MKVNVTRVFDKNIVAGTDSADEIGPFIDWVNDFSDNIVQILSQRVGLDNQDAEQRTVTLLNDTPLTLTLKRRPVEIRVVKSPTTNLMTTQLGWDFVSDLSVRIQCKFENTATTGEQVTIVIRYS